MALELEGKVYKILPEQQGTSQSSGKMWRKAAFVIETLEQYPKKVALTVWNNNVDSVKQLRLGEKVRVNFRVESREYNDRWYTDLTVWSITKILEQDLTAAASAAPTMQAQPDSNVVYGDTNTDTTNTEPTEAPDLSSDDSGDDLPF
jgi:hypothetical protein